MMSEWITFINSLGSTETSIEFLNLKNSIDEAPVLSYDSIEYNDPVNHTKYYKYIQSGLEIGFRKNVVNHIHFYFDECEGYINFKGKLLSGICLGWTRQSVIQELGEPSCSGGGNMDMLLGYINYWIKYERDNYALHLQFNQNNSLCRLTIMQQD